MPGILLMSPLITSRKIQVCLQIKIHSIPQKPPQASCRQIQKHRMGRDMMSYSKMQVCEADQVVTTVEVLYQWQNLIWTNSVSLLLPGCWCMLGGSSLLQPYVIIRLIRHKHKLDPRSLKETPQQKLCWLTAVRTWWLTFRTWPKKMSE